MADYRTELPEGTILIDKKGIRFCLAEVLGKGGSGIIYSAYEEDNGLEYAIKEFYPRCEDIVRGAELALEAASSVGEQRLEGFRALMERERQVGTMAAHRNGHALGLYKDLKISKIIVDDQEYSSEDYHFYLTLSYKGRFKSLAEAIDELNVSENTLAQRLRLFRACVQAVQEIHLRDIVHRDLTPGNIAIFDNSAILLDFGLAQWLGDCDEVETGFVLTTPGFSAPELELLGKGASVAGPGGSVDGAPLRRAASSTLPPVPSTEAPVPKTPSVDVYSLGCILYRILYGNRGLVDEMVLMPGRARAIGATRHIEEINRVLAKSTAVDPGERYGDASELLEAVEELLSRVENPEFASPVPGIAELHNRDRELNELLEMVKKDRTANRIFVTGMSGIGKTTFLQLFGQRYTSGKVIWTTYNDNLKRTIAGLRVMGEEEPKLDTAAQLDKLFHNNLEILSRYTKDDILIIDKYNTDDNWGLEQLLERDRFFETLSNCGMKVILATTCAYDESLLGTRAQAYPLGELSDETLLDMLQRTRRGHFFRDNRDKALELLQRFARNTLLIKLAAAIFDNNRHAASSEQLFADIMCAAEDKLGRIEKDGHINLKGISLEAMMEVMWDVTRFEEPERTNLLYLCTIPESGLEAELFDEMLRQYGVRDVEVFLKLNWLEERAGRYYVHALIREIITQKVYYEHSKPGPDVGPRREVVEKFLEYVAAHYHDTGLLPMFNTGIKLCPHKEYSGALYLEAIGEYKNAFWAFWEGFSDEDVIMHEPKHGLQTIQHMTDMAIASRSRELLTACLNTFMGCMEVTSTKKAIFDECEPEVRDQFKEAIRIAAESMRAVYWDCPKTRELKVGMNRTDLKPTVEAEDINLTDSDYHPTPVTQYWAKGDYERQWNLAMFFMSKMERLDKDFLNMSLWKKLRNVLNDMAEELEHDKWLAKYYSMVYATTRRTSQVLFKSLAGLLEDYLREAGKVLNDNAVNCSGELLKLRKMAVELQNIREFGRLHQPFCEEIDRLQKEVVQTNDGRVNYVTEYYKKLRERCHQADFGIGNEEAPLNVTDMILERVCNSFAHDKKLSGVAGVRRGRILVLIRKAMEYIFSFIWDPMQFTTYEYEDRALRSLKLLNMRFASYEVAYVPMGQPLKGMKNRQGSENDMADIQLEDQSESSFEVSFERQDPWERLRTVYEALRGVSPENGLWRMTTPGLNPDTSEEKAQLVRFLTGLYRYLFAEYDSPAVKGVLIKRIAGSTMLAPEERRKWAELLMGAVDETSYPDEVGIRHTYATLLMEQGLYWEAIHQYEKIMAIRSPRCDYAMKNIRDSYAEALEAVGEHEKSRLVQIMTP